MKSAMAHLLLFLSLTVPAFAADRPVYPGAVLSAEMTRAIQEKYPDRAVYTTPDDFEKVCAFYRTIGTETPTGSLRAQDVKHAGFRFAGTGTGASISWGRRSAATGTVITLGKPDH